MATLTLYKRRGWREARRNRKRGDFKSPRIERLEGRCLLAADLLDFLAPPDPVRAHQVFAPGTPIEIVRTGEQALSLADGTGASEFTFDDGHRWTLTAYDGSNPSQGNPTRLTWSIIPDGTPTVGRNAGQPSGQFSDLIAGMDSIYGSAGEPTLEDKSWFAHFESVFDRWSDVSGIDFIYEAADDGVIQSSGNPGVAGVRGDLRLGGHPIDGPYGILAYNYYPNFGEMVIDTSDTFFADTSSNSLGLRNTVAHELGHGIGISHVWPVNQTKLMEPMLTSNFDGPQLDDVLAAHRGYGDDLEQTTGNDSWSSATDLGSMSPGDTRMQGTDGLDTPVATTETDFVSIDDNSDIDMFRFHVAGPAAVTTDVWPVGPTYLSGPSEATTTLFDASMQSDLSIAVVHSDGVTLLASSNATGLGGAENLTDVVLPGEGDFFVRVAGAEDATQLYQLQVSLESLGAVTTRIIDNGDAAFLVEGDWVQWDGQGYLNDIHEAAAGTGSDFATWTFTGLEAGLYDVAATWSEFGNRATNSPFEILGGDTSLDVIHVNQQLSPSGINDLGAEWQLLGGPYVVAGEVLKVKLTNEANGRVNADAIRIERLGDVTSTPEIYVSDGGTELIDGSSSVLLGSTPVGIPVTRTFTVRNVGLQDLTLTEPIQVPDGFVVSDSFDATTLGPGVSTTFSVQLTATSAGSYGGNVSFDNNDADENPFEFSIGGTVETPPPAPTIQIVDNGDADFTTSGAWQLWGGQGYEGDVHEAFPGTGSKTADWTFSGIVPGVYEVSATWSPYSNRASNSPYEIYDGTSRVATQRVNQQVAPVGFVDDGATWQILGATHSVTSSSLVVRLTDDADGRLNADGVRIERVGDPVYAPEIQVLDGAVNVTDGSGYVSFGSTAIGSPVARTFTVKNVGSELLTLSEPINFPDGFNLKSSFTSTALDSGESAEFQVTLTATDAGTFVGSISFGNNDADENPFDFTIEGTVDVPPAPETVYIMDDGDAEFAMEGAWSGWLYQGYQGDVREAMPGLGDCIASWTFTGLQPGRYEVAATWSAYSNRASNSPFAIYDGTSHLTTERVDQRVAPAGFLDDGVPWQLLGLEHVVTGSTLAVKLSNDADGRLNADAIRIERVGDLISGPEIQVFDGATEILDGSSVVHFGETTPGTPVTRTFTVKNVGMDPLTLSDTILAPSGFTVATPFAVTSLAAGESTEFAIELTASGVGTFSGQLSFVNNDGDENPFNFTLQGQVTDTPTEPFAAIIDNGDVDFGFTGAWSRWTGQGYQDDVHEAMPGSSLKAATWTFNDVPVGTYEVAATWSAYSNRATDAPFTIHDGVTALATRRVDQRVPPCDFSSDGAVWHGLGDYTVGSGTLVVGLSADANGRLNADAIRIERVVSSLHYATAPQGLSAEPAFLGRTVSFAMEPMTESLQPETPRWIRTSALLSEKASRATADRAMAYRRDASVITALSDTQVSRRARLDGGVSDATRRTVFAEQKDWSVEAVLRDAFGNRALETPLPVGIL